MPVFDRKCSVCDWTKDDNYEPHGHEFACPTCGQPTERVFTGRINVIPDTFSKPLVDDNMARTTQVFYSRSEHRAAMKKHGVRNNTQHREFNHSDKSPHTTRWT